MRQQSGQKSGRLQPVRIAAKVTGCYALLGTAWILVSDQFLLSIGLDPAQLTALQSYKGWFFIAASSGVLFWFITVLLSKIHVEQDRTRQSALRFRELINLSPDAILVEIAGTTTYANGSTERLLGTTIAELLKRPLLDFILKPDQHKLIERWKMPAQDKLTANPLELRIKRADGTQLFVQMACGDIDWDGEPAAQYILRDVTELKKTQQQLSRTNEHLQLAIEGTGECIWELDVPGNRVFFRGGLVGVFDAHTQSMEGRPQDWKHLMHPEDIKRVTKTLQATVRGESKIYESEYRLRAMDGTWRWVLARGVVVERDEAGAAITMAGTIADVTARKNSHEMAWRYANLDVLTGLPNRRLFSEKLDAEIRVAKRSHDNLAVLFIDLDGFKRVNDMLGHEAGDHLLLEVASRLSQCVRETDIVARMGGDEFTVVLTRLPSTDHTEFVCQKILERLAEPVHIGKEVAHVSCSIGISLYPIDGVLPEDLLRKADQAMYAAKHSGKNQFHYFTMEMDHRAHARLQIAEALRHALSGNEFRVLYQPVIDLLEGTIVKAEALLRWSNPTLGDVEPARFIPLAEETGLIREIGTWVFMEAAQFSSLCNRKTHRHFQVSINKSPVQFMARDAGKKWLNYLAKNNFSAQGISLEITEGVLLQATDGVAEMLQSYRSAGIELALDDFGTGYSSMAYLQKFKIDYVKIDQSFVRHMNTDSGCLTIVETIIVMAHKLGMKVIAEGIEQQDQYELLKALHCDFGQGYFFTPPLPAKDFLDLIARSPRFATAH